MKKDYYEILGVPKDSSQEYIKRAYRLLAHQYHPDKDGGSEKRFKEIHEVYLILSDDESRKEYDENYDKNKVSNSGSSYKKQHETEPVEKEEKVKEESKIDIEKTKKYIKNTGGLILVAGWLTLIINAIYYIVGFWNDDFSVFNIFNQNHSHFFVIFIVSVVYIILGARIKRLNDIKTKLYLQISASLFFVFSITMIIGGGKVGILFFILAVYIINSLLKINKVMKVKEFTSTFTNLKYKFNKKGWISFGIVSLIIFVVLLNIDSSKTNIDWEKEFSINQPASENDILVESEELGIIPIKSTQEVKESVLPLPTTKSEPNKIINSDISNWITYKSEEDNFSILFPKIPDLDKYTSEEGSYGYKVMNTLVNINVYSASVIGENKYTHFGIAVSSFPNIDNIDNPKDFLNKMLSAYLNPESNNTLISSNINLYKQNYSIDAVVNMDGTIWNKKFIIIGKKVYTFDMFGSENSNDKEIYNKFINSFQTF
jgi:hypothetical protein